MADSGVGQGSFHHHFPTKPGLAREVIAENGRDLLASVREAVDDGSLPPGLDPARTAATLLAG